MATNKPQEDYQKQGVRLPRALHERLHEAAKQSGRSYNSELIARLEAGLDQPMIDAAQSHVTANLIDAVLELRTQIETLQAQIAAAQKK